MSHYGNLDILKIHGMDTEEGEENIYANTGLINIPDVRTKTENSGTKRNQTPKHTESDSVSIRSSSMFDAPVCLVLLCFLLLTVVTVLSILINTIDANYTQEKDELLINITNLTEVRTHLMIRHTNLTKEADQLKTTNTDLARDRDQLKTTNTDLAKERDQLKTTNTDLAKERNQLKTTNTDLAKERDQLKTKNMQLTQERDRVSSNNNELTKQRDLLNQEKNELLKSLHQKDGWIYYQSSLYFISSEKTTWAESRRYCTERGADLIIINNREEQDFAKKTSAGAKVWIGLTDSDVEGKWKWVDGNIQTFAFWSPQEPNSYKGNEDCVLTVSSGWADYPCNDQFQSICEKRIIT